MKHNKSEFKANYKSVCLAPKLIFSDSVPTTFIDTFYDSDITNRQKRDGGRGGIQKQGIRGSEEKEW